MIEQARIRCPKCRRSTPRIVTWAAGDRCPSCGAALARRDDKRLQGSERRSPSARVAGAKRALKGSPGAAQT